MTTRLHTKVMAVTLAAIMLLCGSSFTAKASEQMSGKAITLQDTIRAAIRNNPNLKAFQEYRQAAEHDKSRAFSGFLPRVDGSIGWGVEQWNDSTTRSEAPGTQSKDTYYQRFDTSLTLTQTIWDGLATWSRYRMSDAMLTSAAYRLYDNAEALALDAVLAHMEVCRQQRLVSLSETNVRNHQRILGSQIERQRAGASSLADVTQTQARLARAQASLADSQLALKTAQTNYQKLTGQMPVNLENPTEPTFSYPSLENVLASSMSTNSKIKSKEADIESARYQKNLDTSAFSPTIYFEAGPQYNWQVQSSDTYSWGNAFMLRARWNLFNGFYDWYNVKGSQARIRQANREIQGLRDDLSEETTVTWSNWLTAKEQSKFYNNAVVYNTKTRDMYLQQFNVGQRSLLDLLDSENELYSSSMQLVTSQLNEIAAQYRLMTLGGKVLGYFNVEKESLAIPTDNDSDPSWQNSYSGAFMVNQSQGAAMEQGF